MRASKKIKEKPLEIIVREECPLYRNKLPINYQKTCHCAPTHINCMTPKEWLKSQLGVWQFFYEARDIRNKNLHPATFPIALAKKVIELFTHKGEMVLDPFVGSGTTIVTAISRGFKASGTDINKIAHLITKVKSTPIEPEYLNKKIEQLLSELKYLNGTLFNDKIEPLLTQKHIDRINYWFIEEIKNELGKILRTIYDENDQTIRNFFLVAFSHILKTCSIWLQGSTKPTRDLKKNTVKPYDALRKHLIKMRRLNYATV